MEEEKKQRLIHPETEQKSGGIGGKGEVCLKIWNYLKKTDENSLVYSTKVLERIFESPYIGRDFVQFGKTKSVLNKRAQGLALLFNPPLVLSLEIIPS